MRGRARIRSRKAKPEKEGGADGFGKAIETPPPGCCPRAGNQPCAASRHGRFPHEEEVDIAIVGCGAGGPPCSSAWPGRAGRPWPWMPDRFGIRNGTGSVTSRLAPAVLDRTARRFPATTRYRWAPTTPDAEWADPWCTTPATRPGSIPATSAPTAPMAWVPTGRCSTRTCKLLL